MFLLRERDIATVLKDVGIRAMYETENDFVCLCPFHWNRNSPSMTVSKARGVFNCFNPECGASGDLAKLVMKATGQTFFQVSRYLESHEVSVDELVQDVVDSLDEQQEINLFDQAVIDTTFAAMPDSPGEDYMLARGFTIDTLRHFQVGYSAETGTVTVPVHSFYGEPMGMVGRSIEGKQFKNTRGLQGSLTLWNIHRAKRHGDTIIIVEASFDAMKVHQAGHPNVVALLKGALSKTQASLIERTFNNVVIFVDNDNPMEYPCKECVPRCEGHPPGAKLAYKIYNRLAPSTNVYAVPFSLYHGKDASDMTEDQINRALQGADFYGLDTALSL